MSRTREDLQTAVKAQIRDEMARRGWTQREMAERLGVALPTFNRTLRHSSITTENIERIAHVLGMRATLTLTPIRQ